MAGSQHTVSFSSPVQPSRAPEPMLVREAGRGSSAMPVQPLNAPAPMVVSDSGRVSSVMFVQLRKASSPISVMEPNSSTYSTLLSAKASAPMVVNQPQWWG